MKSRRRRRRKLKKGFKILFMSIPVIAILAVILIFGFRLHTVKVSSDLNQFTESEVKAYMDEEKINNTLFFWLQSKIGKTRQMDLFEEYSVSMNSPFTVTITAYEKKLRGYIKDNGVYYYIDEDGRVLKKSEKKMKDIPKITGMEYNKLPLYNKIEAKDAKAFSALIKVIHSTEEYDFGIKEIQVSKEQEITLKIKKVRVQLGKESNMDKKIQAFNDLYDNVIRYEGVLNMKRLSADNSYTLKKTEKTQKNKKQKKKQ